MTTDETLSIIKHGLFVAPLNNGDWMVGRGSLIYGHIDILTDHYKDPRLSIAPTLTEAIEKWIKNPDPNKMKLTL